MKEQVTSDGWRVASEKALSKAPTPETDAFALSMARTDHGWRTLARRLERERDAWTETARHYAQGSD
jgi:hypothetical protein